MRIKSLIEGGTSRLLNHIQNDENYAIISAYRSENDEATNKSLFSQLKSDIRNKSKLGFIEFVSRWVEDGQAFDERGLLVPGLSYKDAMAYAKQYKQSSVIIKDENGCNEICSTPFDDDDKHYSVGDIVRTYNIDSNAVLNIDDARDIFEKRKGGPASKPVKNDGRPFTLKVKENFEVYEVEQPRPSYFQTKYSYKRII